MLIKQLQQQQRLEESFVFSSGILVSGIALRQSYRDCSLGTAGRLETFVVSKLLSPEALLQPG